MFEKFKKGKWEYIPNPHESHKITYTGFRNNPYPSDEVLDNIGWKGVAQIDKKIKEMLRWREIMYGKDDPKADFSVGSLEFENKDFPDHVVWCHDAGTKLYSLGRNTFTKANPEAFNRFSDYMLKWRKKVGFVLFDDDEEA